jgi:hypothetical protein
MIVKIQQLKGEGGWDFFDKVDSVSINKIRTEKDPYGFIYESKEIRLLRDKLTFNSITVSQGQQAYLLTDAGKTIEKIN